MAAELPTCCICLEEYQHRIGTLKTPCNHEFHEECLRNWLLQSQTCPLCRRNLQDVLSQDLDDGAREVYMAYANRHQLHIRRIRDTLILGASGVEYLMNTMGIEEKLGTNGLAANMSNAISSGDIDIAGYMNNTVRPEEFSGKCLGVLLSTILRNAHVRKGGPAKFYPNGY